jgi:hypothetical protein
MSGTLGEKPKREREREMLLPRAQVTLVTNKAAGTFGTIPSKPIRQPFSDRQTPLRQEKRMETVKPSLFDALVKLERPMEGTITFSAVGSTVQHRAKAETYFCANAHQKILVSVS